MPDYFPSATDQLFATATEPRHEACLTDAGRWPPNTTVAPDPWTRHAIGYKDAADILANEFVKVMHRRDALAYPIVFLYRQYLELALKALVRQAQRYHDRGDEFPKTHRLDELWRLLRGLVDEMGESGDDEMDQTERLIGEFCAIDPESQAFRYPEDRDGNPSLPTIDYLNVVNMRTVVGKIAFLLQCVGLLIQGYEWAKRQGSP